MAIENSPYIAGLNTSIPANVDPRAEGAAQIRGSKTAVKNSFPNIDAPVTATAERMNEVFDSPSQVPIGLIAMWTETTTPEGWADCDGTIQNGYQTPDMRGVFPRGVDDTTELNTTGGTDSPTLSESLEVDAHALGTHELPEHDHEYVDRYYPESEDKLEDKNASNIMANDAGNYVGSNGTDTDNDALLFKTDITGKAGNGQGHTHGLSDSTVVPFDNRPAFYSLRFICYIGK